MSAQPVACRQCGMLNPPDNNFCGRCGTHLSTRPVAPLPSRPRNTAADARNRRNIAIIYAITALFVLTCVLLAVVVIVWQP